jgi:hypothetical protein
LQWSHIALHNARGIFLQRSKMSGSRVKSAAFNK